MAERESIYRQVNPPRDSIPLEIYPFSIDEYIPMVDEIRWAVHRLRQHRLGGGGSGMRLEHLRAWLAEAIR